VSAATTGVVLLVAAAVTVLALQHRAARRADAHERAHVFDHVRPLFADARLTGGGDDGFPVLTGHLAGHPTRLRVIVDALTLRKLPVLWVEITQERPLAVEGSLNVLLRPHGTEFFSPDAGFPHELAAPPGIPRPVRVACAAPERAPSTDVLAPAEELLGDPATKELGLGRRGLRAVLLVAEADQTSYRTARRAVFDRPRVDPDAVARAASVLTAIGDGIGDRAAVPAGSGS